MLAMALLTWIVWAAPAPAADAFALLEKARQAVEAWQTAPGNAALEAARSAVQQAASAAPGQPGLLLLEAELRLGTRDFAEARRLGRAYNRAVPDDLQGYRIIVESCLALGCTPEAEAAGQWMLDLRAKDPLTLRTAARLRRHWGDLDGAREMYQAALVRIQPQQKRERALVLVGLGEVDLAGNRIATAREASRLALAACPELPEARALAQVLDKRPGE